MLIISINEMIEGGLTEETASFIRPKYWDTEFWEPFVPGARVRIIDKEDYLYPSESIIVDHFKIQKGDLRDKNIDGNELDRIRKRWEKHHLFIKIPDNLHSLTEDRGYYYPFWLIEIGALERIDQ